MYMVKLINNLICVLINYHVFIPRNTLLLSKGCFLLLLLKTRSCKEYTAKNFKIPVGLSFNGTITLENLVYAI